MVGGRLWSIVVGIAASAAAPAWAHVSINIGIPGPPPFVIAAPPRLVVVPGTPVVSYAPDLPYNYFAYGGRYYSFHEGAWFMAPGYGGPWTYVEEVRVPRPVRFVPVRYYHVPPGRGWHGHPHGMPPGQAKKIYDRHEWHHGHHHGHD